MHCAAHEASRRLPVPTDRGGYVITALSGELGSASAPVLREQLLSLLRDASHLIINLSAVEHADASVLAVLVGSGRHARLLGGSLRLAAPSLEVARVLSASGMNRHLDIFPPSGPRLAASRDCPRSSRRPLSRLMPTVPMPASQARRHKPARPPSS
jgi:anti-sigma B factor antagonist